ncbi:hypothetical protein LINGRAHAP2_LOCUS6937 [Linum grandiflorum]
MILRERLMFAMGVRPNVKIRRLNRYWVGLGDRMRVWSWVFEAKLGRMVVDVLSRGYSRNKIERFLPISMSPKPPNLLHPTVRREVRTATLR